ncbi:hypothetical protein L6452_14749 [Arctium lappa]|uniref:Uncharacterized protein n=1 Tax=Arctium lappa TaxID=4217 RepID=A0ACB9CLW6_ARCLA|nr:hypothetical protein L6452_14749 [Arctium lappa]
MEVQDEDALDEADEVTRHRWNHVNSGRWDLFVISVGGVGEEGRFQYHKSAPLSDKTGLHSRSHHDIDHTSHVASGRFRKQIGTSENLSSHFLMEPSNLQHQN